MIPGLPAIGVGSAFDPDAIFGPIARGIDPVLEARNSKLTNTLMNGQFKLGPNSLLVPYVVAVVALAEGPHLMTRLTGVAPDAVRIGMAVKGRVPLQWYFHQGGHGGAPPLEMMNKWFTRFLYGVENGVEREPKACELRASRSIRA